MMDTDKTLNMSEEERKQHIAKLKEELAKLEKPPHNDWHSWFHALLNLKLYKFLDKITIDPEPVLGVEPPRADFLILTEEEGLDLGLEVFQIFRKHNVIEFKSPDDELNEKVFERRHCAVLFQENRQGCGRNLPRQRLVGPPSVSNRGDK